MLAPIITFRQTDSPYSIVSNPYLYNETVALQPSLPIIGGDTSDTTYFRIYNNYDLAIGVADAYNITITSYDSSTVLTASTSPVSQMWLYFSEVGFGQNSSQPGPMNTTYDDFIAVGGSSNIKSFPYSSSGSADSRIKAGSDGNGCGFIEVGTYASISLLQSTNVWTPGVAVQFEWIT